MTYVLKKELINVLLSYSCLHRKCNSSLKISVENAKNINKNEINNKAFDFNFLGIHENHSIYSKEDIWIGEIKTEKENYELAKKLIRNNLTLPLSFHIKISNLIKFNYQEQKLKIFYKYYEKKIPKRWQIFRTYRIYNN